ncbi:MAG: sulfite oxidase [Thermoanaerobaculia bacterium]|nr:sulfite oxidase [Thermoanaerobaculia bacterium]
MPLDPENLTRRQLLAMGGTALAVSRLFEGPLFAQVWPGRSGEAVVPFLDPTPDPPQPDLAALNSFSWPELRDWITPNEDFFVVAHYDRPEIDPGTYRLSIGGRVRQELSLSLADIRAMPRREVTYTLECAGNDGFPWFVSGLGNARWAGTPLAPILERAGLLDEAIEVVFFGRDAGEEEFARKTVPQRFARSMSVEDATGPDLLLCYEMNGEPLPRDHGAPLRLLAPGWFGIANVKWLDRIEVWTHRYAGRFMARDYVTVREEPRDGREPLVTQKVVARSLLKSVPARVTHADGQYRVYGAAWGAPIARVEVRVDDGGWQRATIDVGGDERWAWKFWHVDLGGLQPGEHAVTARAVDSAGNVQPRADDPVVAKKLTYWESNGQVTRRFAVA